VADLPGELFAPDTVVPRERVKLRAYDALVWVVDPVVATEAMDRLAEDSLHSDAAYANILDGSLRPGTTATAGRDRVRINRDNIQVDIGQHLTRVDGMMTANQGGALQMLVAVTKCDMLHAALRKKTLHDLGPENVVMRGVAGYLAFLSRRFAQGEIDADDQSAKLLRYLHGGASVDQEVRQRRTLQVADGLLTHYSVQGNFWNLVHTGNTDRVEIPSGAEMALHGWRLEVPSLGAHLDASLPAGSSRRILLRDLVMSSVGCGVAYGLGHENALFQLLRENWQVLRFFLCSPLGTVPRATDEELLTPLESTARFPRVSAPSAALTQLLLSVLGKARL
jgi:hypothetical protein